ncbi:helix-turn-helix domain-containing protein [Miniimonas arenae]|uniref:helix-turn-helix domain-containing protein n=1 Tax=Miniimonas arenae TaxID=676201 RepID=UPI0028AF64B3|nr:helix-turn-helix transcriptional regulator [Miniimonas arenae]
MPAEPPTDRDLALRLGRRLAGLRAATGLTQEQVAIAAGLNRNHYQLLESGLSDRRKNTPANPRLSTLVALSAVLRTTVPELVVDLVPNDGDTHLEYRGSPHA